MVGNLKQLRVLIFAAGCGVIVPSAFLCGCNSHMNLDADKEAVDRDKTDIPNIEQAPHKTLIAYLKKAVATNPDNAGAYVLMGNTHYELGQHADAIAAYKKAIAIEPGHAEAYYHMGSAYIELRQYVEAIAACKKAIALKPDNAYTYLYMGIAYDMLKQNKLAITAFEKFIALNPRGQLADLAREGIRRFRGQ